MAVKKEETVTIGRIEVARVPITIVGDTPLIVHRWSEKAKKQILDTQMKATKTKGKAIRDPFDDFAQALYWITDKPDDGSGSGEGLGKITEEMFEEAVKNGAKFGFPTNSIKMAGNAAAYRLGWVKNQMQLRGSYFLRSEYGELAEIKGDVPVIREDNVVVGMGSADLRYRPEFRNWHMDLILEYNANGDMTLEQILNCINAGGYACGIGEWRPERDGDFGRYHLAT